MSEIRFQTHPDGLNSMESYDRFGYDIRVNLDHLGDDLVASALKAIDADIRRLKATLATAAAVDREAAREKRAVDGGAQ